MNVDNTDIMINNPYGRLTTSELSESVYMW